MADEKQSKPKQQRKRSGNPMPIPGPGRPKGSVNRSTANAREAIARLVDNNADRIQGWLDEIEAQQGAKAALACFTDLIEYHVPKLARTELTGKDGGAVDVNARIVVEGMNPDE